MTSSYDQDMPAKDDMTVSTQFMFTEGHIRLLIWMCEAQAQFIDEACDDVLRSGEHPSDSLLHCREGVADLKCWGLRLLEALEEDDDEDEAEDDDEDDEELAAGTRLIPFHFRNSFIRASCPGFRLNWKTMSSHERRPARRTECPKAR